MNKIVFQVGPHPRPRPRIFTFTGGLYIFNHLIISPPADHLIIIATGGMHGRAGWVAGGAQRSGCGACRVCSPPARPPAQADAPDHTTIEPADLIGPTVVLLTCSYFEQVGPTRSLSCAAISSRWARVSHAGTLS